MRQKNPIILQLDAALFLLDLRAVYLHIGGNDLSDPSLNPVTVAQRIMSLAKYALSSSDTIVITIGQLFVRYNADAHYNKRI